jgi:hypothetical protein
MVEWRDEPEDAMSLVTLDAELIAKLTSDGGRVPLTDPDGKTVGYFISPDRLAMLEKGFDESLADEPTEEEVRAALANPKRYSMEEVMKLLEDE